MSLLVVDMVPASTFQPTLRVVRSHAARTLPSEFFLYFSLAVISCTSEILAWLWKALTDIIRIWSNRPLGSALGSVLQKVVLHWSQYWYRLGSRICDRDRKELCRNAAARRKLKSVWSNEGPAKDAYGSFHGDVWLINGDNAGSLV